MGASFLRRHLGRGLQAGFRASLALALLGCTGVSGSEPNRVAAPLETANAQSSLGADGSMATPAAAGIAQAIAAPLVQQISLVQGLEHPWGLAWLPNGDLLVTERGGGLKLVKLSAAAGDLVYGDAVVSGRVVAVPDVEAIAGVPGVFASGQGGLMDVALHPDFANNQLVYFTYADGEQSANRTKVARAKFDGQALTDWQEVFANPDAKSGSQHFGSRLAWLPDGTLLVAIGDGGNPPVSFNGDLIRNQAQNLGSYFGKVIRINADGSVPADNPFVNRSGARPEIWSYGHRNIQGLAVNPATGEVWATEHGARGGDELNQLEAGANYGWPAVSFSREYSTGQPVAAATSQPGMVDPLLEWTPAIAPSGLAIYGGDAVPAWQDNLFAGGLRSQEVVRIDPTQPGMPTEAIAFDQRVRDVRVGPDGFVYVLTDDRNGQLIRLGPQG